jgi:hypothetical protein
MKIFQFFDAFGCLFRKKSISRHINIGTIEMALNTMLKYSLIIIFFDHGNAVHTLKKCQY